MIPKNRNLRSDEFKGDLLYEDSRWMWRALALARRGCGTVAPNPMVGAIVVKDGVSVGQGWHLRAGESHAEVLALNMAGGKAIGSTVYVTLEPCNHDGRTPPCTKALIDAGVRRVVIAMKDPNPKVLGGGVLALKDAGIDVQVGLLEGHANALNAGWIHWVKTGRPYVILKLAVSLDGRIANELGESKSGALEWITGSCSRAMVHRMRRWSDAVMVGAGTVRLDNPRLTYRSSIGNSCAQMQPIRIVVDANLTTNYNSLVYQTLEGRALGHRAGDRAQQSIVICSCDVSKTKQSQFIDAGIKVCEVGIDCAGKLDMNAAIDTLGGLGIQSVLCEGGGKLAASLMQAGVVNRLVLFYGARIIGSKGYPCFDTEWIGDKRISDVSVGNKLSLCSVNRIGSDIIAQYAAPKP